MAFGLLMTSLLLLLFSLLLLLLLSSLLPHCLLRLTSIAVSPFEVFSSLWLFTLLFSGLLLVQGFFPILFLSCWPLN